MSDTATAIPKTYANDSPGQLDDTGESAISGTKAALSLNRGIVPRVRDANVLAQVIDIDRLHEVVPGSTSQMLGALEMLKQVSDFLAEANRAENPMAADRWVQRVQVALPKLFGYRSIGDGFGVIVNSLHFAFVNLHGTPLRTDQITVMWRVLRELRSRPAMPIEQGIQRVQELEESGLEVDPPDIGYQLENFELTENE